mmetsp:Transcript_5572/g.13909  ORF Transcript_5572/g.13909 Transcript_5572/m.13909 type:complete len:255 (-) Transcript_5572:66-830(-)
MPSPAIAEYINCTESSVQSAAMEIPRAACDSEELIASAIGCTPVGAESSTFRMSTLPKTSVAMPYPPAKCSACVLLSSTAAASQISLSPCALAVPSHHCISAEPRPCRRYASETARFWTNPTLPSWLDAPTTLCMRAGMSWTHPIRSPASSNTTPISGFATALKKTFALRPGKRSPISRASVEGPLPSKASRRRLEAEWRSPRPRTARTGRAAPSRAVDVATGRQPQSNASAAARRSARVGVPPLACTGTRLRR